MTEIDYAKLLAGMRRDAEALAGEHGERGGGAKTFAQRLKALADEALEAER